MGVARSVLRAPAGYHCFQSKAKVSGACVDLLQLIVVLNRIVLIMTGE